MQLSLKLFLPVILAPFLLINGPNKKQELVLAKQVVCTNYLALSNTSGIPVTLTVTTSEGFSQTYELYNHIYLWAPLEINAPSTIISFRWTFTPPSSDIRRRIKVVLPNGFTHGCQDIYTGGEAVYTAGYGCGTYSVSFNDIGKGCH